MAETESGSSRRWLERALRLAPDQPMPQLSLALAFLSGGDPAQGAALFDTVLVHHDLADAWLGLAACRLQLGDPAGAAVAMSAALSRHVLPSGSHALAAAIAGAAGLPGWCSAAGPDRVVADAAAELELDGEPIRPRWTRNAARIPPGDSLAATRGGRKLLGSPIDLRRLRRVEGFVEVRHGGIHGWAWYPADPARDPVLTVETPAGPTTLCARDPVEDLADFGPLARPRSFRIGADGLPDGPVRVTADGQDLLGSPLDPGQERRSAAGEGGFRPVWADVVGRASTLRPVRPALAVVMPVHGGGAVTLAAIDSVLAGLPRGGQLVVVDDAGPEPALAAALDALARRKRIRLLRLPANRGFPGAANAGLALAVGRDAVLLNSDTLVPSGTLAALQDALHGAPDIGSACPLSNDATILSYPDPVGGNPMPDLAGTVALAGLAAAANGTATVDIPVAVGFCMAIRRDCLDQVGLLREDVFAQGYGEENDWCLRARHAGWRHVAVPGSFVAHQGGTSFRAARQHLLRRNAAVLDRLHPGYEALVAEWVRADPLQPARRRLDEARWAAGRRAGAVLLVTHAGGGGVDRVIADRVALAAEAGLRPVVLRPAGPALVVGDGSTPNLRFRLPEERAALLRLLRAERPRHVELHHTLGHHDSVAELAAALRVPQDVFVHDYAAFCPRIALVPEHAYCGEPPVETCEHCVADHGSNLEIDIPVAELVAGSAAVMAAARSVVVPARDVANRIRRHFPAVRPVVTPWEDDAALVPPPPTAAVDHVCVIGAIGVEKGFERLLGCVRDAAGRGLPLRFTVIGHTADDERLMDAGPCFVSGRYDPAGATALIRSVGAQLALIPSIWPETWCFTLTEAWRAGLRAAVLDIGAPAERVRATGWGAVLPLGLPPPGINDWLLRAGARQTVSPFR